MNRIYSEDKPKECRHCYFYDKRRCILDRCYYKLPEENDVGSGCDDCPYGKYAPCIGWCTKEILRSVRRCIK